MNHDVPTVTIEDIQRRAAERGAKLAALFPTPRQRARAARPPGGDGPGRKPRPSAVVNGRTLYLCETCRRWKRFGEYYARRTYAGGLAVRAHCKACQYKAEKARAKAKSYRSTDSEKSTEAA